MSGILASASMGMMFFLDLDTDMRSRIERGENSTAYMMPVLPIMSEMWEGVVPLAAPR